MQTLPWWRWKLSIPTVTCRSTGTIGIYYKFNGMARSSYLVYTLHQKIFTDLADPSESMLLQVYFSITPCVRIYYWRFLPSIYTWVHSFLLPILYYLNAYVLQLGGAFTWESAFTVHLFDIQINYAWYMYIICKSRLHRLLDKCYHQEVWPGRSVHLSQSIWLFHMLKYHHLRYMTPTQSLRLHINLVTPTKAAVSHGLIYLNSFFYKKTNRILSRKTFAYIVAVCLCKS